MADENDGLGRKLPPLGNSVYAFDDYNAPNSPLTSPEPTELQPYEHDTTTTSTTTSHGKKKAYTWKWKSNDGILTLHVQEQGKSRDAPVTVSRLGRMTKATIVDLLVLVLKDSNGERV